MTKNIQVPDDFLQNLDTATAILGATVIQMQKHKDAGFGTGYAATQDEIDKAADIYSELHEFLKSALDTHSTVSDWGIIIERSFRDSSTTPDKF